MQPRSFIGVTLSLSKGGATHRPPSHHPTPPSHLRRAGAGARPLSPAP